MLDRISGIFKMMIIDFYIGFQQFPQIKNNFI